MKGSGVPVCSEIGPSHRNRRGDPGGGHIAVGRLLSRSSWANSRPLLRRLIKELPWPFIAVIDVRVPWQVSQEMLGRLQTFLKALLIPSKALDSPVHCEEEWRQGSLSYLIVN